jgi:hypothetical protein
VILLRGIPSESPVAMVAEALRTIGANYRVLNQRQVADCVLGWQIETGFIDGARRLAGIRAAYVRLMDANYSGTSRRTTGLACEAPCPGLPRRPLPLD